MTTRQTRQLIEYIGDFDCAAGGSRLTLRPSVNGYVLEINRSIAGCPMKGHEELLIHGGELHELMKMFRDAEEDQEAERSKNGQRSFRS